MVSKIKEWLMKDRTYFQDVHAYLHLTGSAKVPKDVVRNSEIFDEGYVYLLELTIDGFMEITAHKKIKELPDNVVNLNR